MAYDADDDNSDDYSQINVGPWRPGKPTVVWTESSYRAVLHYTKVTYEKSETDAMGQERWVKVLGVEEPKLIKLILAKVFREEIQRLDAMKNMCAAEDVNYVDPAAGCLPAETPPSAPGSVPDDEIPF